jgi:uncharacterized protein (TIGR00730 family)
MAPLKIVCVFCGSSNGTQPVYQQAARALGRELVDRGLDLVYGGGGIGLMGVIAAAVDAGGRDVLGIIPRALEPKNLSGVTYGRVMVVESMPERKRLMAQHSDAFIAMPGGFGTLDELFEMVTWGQLGIHAKPVGLLNVDGYFDPLLQWIDGAIAQGFIRETYKDLLLVDQVPAALLESMAAHTPPAGLLTWLDSEQSEDLT